VCMQVGAVTPSYTVSGLARVNFNRSKFPFEFFLLAIQCVFQFIQLFLFGNAAKFAVYARSAKPSVWHDDALSGSPVPRDQLKERFRTLGQKDHTAFLDCDPWKQSQSDRGGVGVRGAHEDRAEEHRDARRPRRKIRYL